MKSQRGYTLIEILITVGLMFVIASGISIAFLNFTVSNKQTKLRMARQSLLLDIKNQLAKPRLLEWSSKQTGNENLLSCVSNNPAIFNAATCWAMTTAANSANRPQALTLYALNSTTKIAEGDLDDTTKAIRYTLEGNRCPSATAYCPLVVQVFFMPVCRVQGYSIPGSSSTITYTQQQRCTNTTTPSGPDAHLMAAVATNQIYDIFIHYRIAAEFSTSDKFIFKNITTLPSSITVYGSDHSIQAPLVISAVRIGDPTKY